MLSRHLVLRLLLMGNDELRSNLFYDGSDASSVRSARE
jgi:hypothetical protein